MRPRPGGGHRAGRGPQGGEAGGRRLASSSVWCDPETARRWSCRQAAPSPGETPMRPACHDPGFGVIPDRATGTANPAPRPSRDGRCAPGSPRRASGKDRRRREGVDGMARKNAAPRPAGERFQGFKRRARGARRNLCSRGGTGGARAMAAWRRHFGRSQTRCLPYKPPFIPQDRKSGKGGEWKFATSWTNVRFRSAGD